MFLNQLIENFKKSAFLQNVAKLLSVNLLIQVIAFLLSIIIAHLYTQDDFGVLAKFMSIAGIFILFATARLEFALILPKKVEEANALFVTTFYLSLISAFSSFVFLFFFSDRLNNYFNISVVQDWFFLMPAVVFFMAMFTVLINYKNREKKYGQLAIGQTIQGVSNPMASIGLKSILNYGLIQALFVSNFLGTTFLSFSLRKEKVFSKKTPIKEVLKKYYRFPTFNLMHALVNNISANLPVLMLSPIFENYVIGLFTMALGKIFRPIHLLGSVIYQVFSKKIVDDMHLKKDVSAQFRKLIGVLILIGIVPFSIMYMYAPQIFSLVFGDKWFQAGVYLKLLLPWLFMVYLLGSVSFMPNVLGQQKKALYLEIVHLVLRFGALSYGISKSSLEIALSAYSTVGVFVLLITLFWYYYLIKNVKEIND